MKKRVHFSVLCLFLFALLISVSVSAASPTTTAKSTASLTDVRDAAEVFGTWETTSEGVKFLQENGKYVKNKWICFADNIYYMNKNGFRTTVCVIFNNNYYYLNKKGAMVIGWRNKN